MVYPQSPCGWLDHDSQNANYWTARMRFPVPRRRRFDRSLLHLSPPPSPPGPPSLLPASLGVRPHRSG
eukprot:368638-Pyramimonas_sp.AAC.1